VAHAVDGFAIRRIEDSTVLEVDLDEPDTVDRVMVALHARAR
jgi:tRNA(Ser,Leu) C12 N-acetylase TAN1